MSALRPMRWLAAMALAIGAAPAGAAALPAHTGSPSDAAPVPAGGTLRLAALMATLAQRRVAEAHFQETQYLSILTQPLHSEGVLIYRAPDYLEQRVERPAPQDMIVQHGQLTMQLGRRRRTVPLADYPQLAPLLESLRATLAGDGRQLQRLFEVRLSGTLEDWTLGLTPRGGALDAALSAIELHGTGTQIRTVRFRQRNGDHALLQIRSPP